MRKRSFIIRCEKGFAFVHILWFITFLFIVHFYTIYMYQQEIELTNLHFVQLKAETLFQKAYTNFKQEFLQTSGHNPVQTEYIFPDGHVLVQLEPLNEEWNQLFFRVTIEEQYSIIFLRPIKKS